MNGKRKMERGSLDAPAYVAVYPGDVLQRPGRIRFDVVSRDGDSMCDALGVDRMYVSVNRRFLDMCAEQSRTVAEDGYLHFGPDEFLFDSGLDKERTCTVEARFDCGHRFDGEGNLITNQATDAANAFVKYMEPGSGYGGTDGWFTMLDKMVDLRDSVDEQLRDSVQDGDVFCVKSARSNLFLYEHTADGCDPSEVSNGDICGKDGFTASMAFYPCAGKDGIELEDRDGKTHNLRFANFEMSVRLPVDTDRLLETMRAFTKHGPESVPKLRYEPWDRDADMAWAKETAERGRKVFRRQIAATKSAQTSAYAKMTNMLARQDSEAEEENGGPEFD